MAHTVIGYPSLADSKKIVQLYANEGFEILELQIPFSHPTADGTVLTQANRVAVENTSLQQSLDFLAATRTEFSEQKIMVMTYLNKLFAYGLTAFCDQLQTLSIPYLIIPDLPFDSPLANQIHEHPYVQLVPVLSANVKEERLTKALSTKPDYVYLMADFKITGSAFSIHENVVQLIQKIKALHPAKVGLGFGIANAEQVQIALSIADFAIMGSALTKAINENCIEAKVQELKNGLAEKVV